MKGLESHAKSTLYPTCNGKLSWFKTRGSEAPMSVSEGRVIWVAGSLMAWETRKGWWLRNGSRDYQEETTDMVQGREDGSLNQSRGTNYRWRSESQHTTEDIGNWVETGDEREVREASEVSVLETKWRMMFTYKNHSHWRDKSQKVNPGKN